MDLGSRQKTCPEFWIRFLAQRAPPATALDYHSSTTPCRSTTACFTCAAAPGQGGAEPCLRYFYPRKARSWYAKRLKRWTNCRSLHAPVLGCGFRRRCRPPASGSCLLPACRGTFHLPPRPARVTAPPPACL